MSDFRQFAANKNAHTLNELQALLDELANAYKFGATLILSALKDLDSEVRCYAARKLGLAGLGRQDIVNGLVEALNDDSTEVRQYVSAALGVLDPLPLSAAPAIKQAIGDVDEAVSEFSASTLKLIEKQIASEAMQMNNVDGVRLPISHI